MGQDQQGPSGFLRPCTRDRRAQHARCVARRRTSRTPPCFPGPSSSSHRSSSRPEVVPCSLRIRSACRPVDNRPPTSWSRRRPCGPAPTHPPDRTLRPHPRASAQRSRPLEGASQHQETRPEAPTARGTLATETAPNRAARPMSALSIPPRRGHAELVARRHGTPASRPSATTPRAGRDLLQVEPHRRHPRSAPACARRPPWRPARGASSGPPRGRTARPTVRAPPRRLPFRRHDSGIRVVEPAVARHAGREGDDRRELGRHSSRQRQGHHVHPRRWWPRRAAPRRTPMSTQTVDRQTAQRRAAPSSGRPRGPLRAAGQGARARAGCCTSTC